MAWRWKRTMPTAITLIITYCILVAFTPVAGSTTGVQDAYIARVCLQGMELEGGIWWDDWNPGCLVYEKGWYYNTQIYSCRYYSESLKHPLINQSVYIMKCQWWVMLRVFASLTPPPGWTLSTVARAKGLLWLSTLAATCHLGWLKAHMAAVWLVDWTFSELGLRWETGNK